MVDAATLHLPLRLLLPQIRQYLHLRVQLLLQLLVQSATAFQKRFLSKVNFSGTCEDTNVDSAAVREKACLVAGFEFPVVDNEPVEMNSIAVYELDADSKSILQQKTMNRSFQNGDIFSYTAYTDESAMTGAIQLRILARNRSGETICD